MTDITLLLRTRAIIFAELDGRSEMIPAKERVEFARSRLSALGDDVKKDIVELLYKVVDSFWQSNKGRLRQLRLSDHDPHDLAHRLFELLPQILIAYDPVHSGNAKISSFVHGFLKNVMRDLARDQHKMVSLDTVIRERGEPVEASHRNNRSIDPGYALTQLRAELTEVLEKNVKNAAHRRMCQLRWLNRQSVATIVKDFPTKTTLSAVYKAIGRTRDETLRNKIADPNKLRRILLFIQYLEQGHKLNANGPFVTGG